MNDKTRAAILALAQSLFPVLQILGFLTFTADEVALIMLLIGNALTVVALVVKEGQEPSPTQAAAIRKRLDLLEKENNILRGTSTAPPPLTTGPPTA